ncbi:MAG: flagellar FlbD family protein [Lachnospiraceae bacterium]|nr:flagellar FlbD family protein [Lachnospiraceae bacterium]
MIKVVRLNGEVLYLNYLQILYLESIPETKIKLVNGDFFIVKDSVESVIEQVNRLIANILMFRDKEADEGKLSQFREV